MMMVMMMMWEEEGRLDTEDHPAHQQTPEQDLPCADLYAENYPGEEDRPQRLREHDGEGVPQGHVEDTRELEQYSQAANQTLQQHQELVQLLIGKK